MLLSLALIVIALHVLNFLQAFAFGLISIRKGEVARSPYTTAFAHAFQLGSLILALATVAVEV